MLLENINEVIISPSHNDTLLVVTAWLIMNGFCWSSLLVIDHRQRISICPEAFAATECSEIFSGRQPRQGVKVFRRFSYFVLIFRVLPNHQQHPEDGNGFSPWLVGKPSHLDAVVCPMNFHGTNFEFSRIHFPVRISISQIGLLALDWIFFFFALKCFALWFYA